MNKNSATVLPPAPAILNERPKKMSMEEYRKQRAEMNRQINARVKKGFLVHLSNELLFDAQGRPIAMRYKRGRTHVGTTAHLQLV